MDNIKTLIGLEYKRYKNVSTKKLAGEILSYIGQALFVFMFAFIIVGFFYLSGKRSDANNYLSLIISIIQVILLIHMVSSMIKTVYLNLDKSLLAFLPVSKWEIYTAKLLVCIFKTYILNFILSIPTLILFGIFFNMNALFYVIGIISTLLIPLIPIALSMLTAVPIMYAYNWLKNQNLLNLIISIALTIGGFYLYSRLIFNIADIVLLKYKTSNILIDFANVFKSEYFPSTWFSSAIISTSNLKYFLYILGVSVGSVTLFYLLGAYSYNRYFINSLITRTFARTIKTTNKKRNPLLSYFVMEVKEIFRSASYSFTYFGMAVAMPLMVLICNSFIVKFAIEKLGHQIIFGTTLLVVLVFVAMICSPSATFISKEGESFWILKTNPVGIKLPLIAKSLVGIMSCTISLLITSIVIVAFKYVTIVEGLAIFGMGIVFMFGVISLGLFINLLRPNIFTTNYHNHSNMATLMIAGFLLSLIIGVGAIILCLIQPISFVLTVSFAALIVFTAICMTVLFTNYSRLYYKAEV